MLAIEDEDGNHLSDEEILGNAVFLLNAGNQTTQNLLMNLVHQLITADRWHAVRDDRSLVPVAVEESLRLTPPIQYGVRRPTADTTIAGCPVHEGEVLVLSHLAANRDPDVWGEDASRFNLDRHVDAKHLGFGMGPHSCVGSAVARKVAVISMNALLDRFESMRLAPEFTWERQEYWTSMGMVALDVEWDR
jgi:cytochrome P450